LDQLTIILCVLGVIFYSDMNLFKLSRVAFLIIVSVTLLCLENCIAQDINEDMLSSKLLALEKQAYMSGASLSLSIYDVDSQEEVFSHNGDKLMIPASIQKLITSSAALHYLGKNYRFKTYLESDGTIESGTLKGNLYLRGSGDPTLGSSRDMKSGQLNIGESDLIASWVKVLQSQGIHKIDGGIYADDGSLDQMPAASKWLWEDVGNYYGSGIHGLTYHENLYHITYNTSGGLGSKAEILSVRPKPIDLKIINEVYLAEKGTGDQAYVYGGPYSNSQVVKGTLPIGQAEYTIKAAIPDPGNYLAQNLTRAIMKKGVMVSSPSSTCYMSEEACCEAKDRNNVIHIEESIRLSEIVRLCHLKSINTYSEAMLKAIPIEANNLGTSEAGTQMIMEYLTDMGINTSYVHLYDGSGLSRVNAISTDSFAKFLAKSKNTSGDIYNSLRENGKLRYKTGYMERVRSHAGYFSSNGKTYSYSLIVNNYSGSSSTMRKDIQEILSVF